MEWFDLRGRKGMVPFWPRLAEAAGGANRGLFLSASLAMAADAGGPFVRYHAGGRPRWDEVVPLDRHTLRKLDDWLFGPCDDAGDSPLAAIRRFSCREGKVYDMHRPEVLQAVSLLIEGAVGENPDDVRPGRMWWTGPVAAWKASVIGWLRASGLDAGLSTDLLNASLGCLLDDLFRDHRDNVLDFGPGGRGLTAFVRRRYTPVEGSILPFLEYDAVWAAIRAVTGLEELRPPTGSRENVRLRRGLFNLLGTLRGLGVPHLDYLSCFHKRRLEGGKPPTLKEILNPPPDILAMCGVQPSEAAHVGRRHLPRT